MGIVSGFKNWKKDRQSKDITKKQAIVKNAKAIKDERNAAIDFFCDYSEPEVAVKSLLDRFEFSIENGISDTREKDKCFDGIIRHEQAALPFVQQRLIETSRIAWPIKILEKLSDDEKTVVESLKNTLVYDDVRFDQAQVDKNYDILCYLRDYKLDNFVNKLAHFLGDTDERVRHAAVDTIIEQNDEIIPQVLEIFLSDATSENRRIKKSVVDAFIARDWTVKDLSKFPDGKIEDRILVTKKGKVQALPER